MESGNETIPPPKPLKNSSFLSLGYWKPRKSCFADYREVDGGVSEVYYRFSGYTQKDFQIQFNVDGAGGFTVSFFS